MGDGGGRGGPRAHRGGGVSAGELSARRLTADGLLNPDAWLERDEQERLVMALMGGETERGRPNVPEKVLLAFLEWATLQRILAGLLANVLDGTMHVEWQVPEDGNLEDGEPAFWLTPKGVAASQAIIQRAGLHAPVEETPVAQDQPDGFAG